MKNLTPEMIEKAKAAKSAEELLELAKANGVEMTADEAKTYFAQLNPKSGELDDDDLDAVAGGACEDKVDGPPLGTVIRITSGQTCRYCKGDTGVIEWGSIHHTEKAVRCNNCDARIHYDVYYLTYEIIS